MNSGVQSVDLGADACDIGFDLRDGTPEKWACKTAEDEREHEKGTGNADHDGLLIRRDGEGHWK